MTAKEYLRKVHDMRRRQDRLLERLIELKEQAQGIKAITYDKDRVQTSPVNRFEELMVRLADLETRYAFAIARYNTEIQQIEAQIENLDNADYEEVLRLRYLVKTPNYKPMRLEEIALRMHKSYPRIRHMHGEALEEFRRRFL